MGRRKEKQSREETLEKKKQAERLRKKRIKDDPVLGEELRRKDRERYKKKKAKGKILSMAEMTPRARRLKQKINRANFKAFYERRKRNTKLSLDENLPSENVPPKKNNIPPKTQGDGMTGASSPTSPSILNRSRSLSPQPGPSHDGNFNFNFQRSRSISPRSSISRCLRSKNKIFTSSPVHSYLPSGRITAAVSRIQTPESTLCLSSPITTLCPNSPVSTLCPSSPVSTLCPNSPAPSLSDVSSSLKDLDARFRKYQRIKAKEIMSLRKKVIQLKREKDLYRKRAERLNKILKSPRLENKIVKKKIKSDDPKNKNKINAQVRNTVQKFYEEDENSSMCPGKKDCITKSQVKKQKRYLTDSIKNLHQKYLKLGHPPIGYTTFSKLRPFWILKPNINNRNTCLCQIHANMELLITSLKRNKIIKENTTTDLLKNMCCDKDSVKCLERKCLSCRDKVVNYQEFSNQTNITYWAWQQQARVYTKDNVEKTTRTVTKISHSDKPLAVIKRFENALKSFLKHCANLKNQYQAVKGIKENMTESQCLIHIDFSENYGTKYNEEVQSVHWSKNQITLHTVVIYYHGSQTYKTQAFCTISASLRHDAAAVWAHLVPILREIETNAPMVRTLHIVSDSPSAQYRNKKILYIISQLSSYCSQLNEIIWHYTECGHGKGAPDGVGGVLKRTADQLVAYGKDIADLDTLVQNLKTSVKGVKIEVVEDYKITEKDWLLPDQLKTFPGTLKVHQIVWMKEEPRRLALRSLSCTHLDCLIKAKICPHGKHLGFYDIACNDNSQSRDQKDCFMTQLDLQRYSTSSTESKVQILSVQRFKASERFDLVKPSIKSQHSRNPFDKKLSIATIPSKSLAILDDSLSIENVDLDIIPSPSFFENVDSAMCSELENSIPETNWKKDDKTKKKKETRLAESSTAQIKTNIENDSDSDLNIF